MAIDPSALGSESPEFSHQYDFRALSLYALSAGATPERELSLLFERQSHAYAAPTYPVVPALAAVEWCQARLGGTLSNILHGAQRIWLQKPVPLGATLTTRAQIVGVYDLRRMAQSVIRTQSRDAAGALVAETEWTILHMNEGGFDGEAPPAQANNRAPRRAPDASVRIETSPAQAALYRLNGDLNPLHIDPDTARDAGYDRPILHGLGTLAVASVALSRAGVPLPSVSLVEATFRAPIFPGDPLITELWRDANRVWFQSYAEGRADGLAIRHGYMELGLQSP
jgi:acyl dehydratase